MYKSIISQILTDDYETSISVLLFHCLRIVAAKNVHSNLMINMLLCLYKIHFVAISAAWLHCLL